MNSESFVFYESVYKQAAILEKRLGKAAAYDFLNAVMEFGLYGVLPDEDNAVWLYGFEQTITSIGAAKSRYNAAVENGKKGGRPAKIDKTQVIELKNKGFTHNQIAKELECSLSSIEKIVAEYRKNRKNLNDNVNDNDNDNTEFLRRDKPSDKNQRFEF